MKKNIHLAVITGACLLMGNVSVQAGDFMSAENLKGAITGKTCKGMHLKKDYAYSIYFSPDGALHQVKEDDEKRDGTWSVDNSGRHCVEWSGSGVTKCFPMKDNGDGSYTKVKVKGDKEIHLIRLSACQDGNGLK